MNFNKLIQENKNNVKKIIKQITKENNEDIEQEVYIKVWQNRDKYQEQGKIKGWVGTIARNLSKDYLKSAYVKNRADSDDEAILNIKDRKSTPELKLIRNERQEKIINAINALKPKYKEIVMLCEIQQLSYEEASKILNCPLGTVKSRLFNAKKELYIKLQDLI